MGHFIPLSGYYSCQVLFTLIYRLHLLYKNKNRKEIFWMPNITLEKLWFWLVELSCILILICQSEGTIVIFGSFLYLCQEIILVKCYLHWYIDYIYFIKRKEIFGMQNITLEKLWFWLVELSYNLILICRDRGCMVVGFFNCMCNMCLSPLTLWVRIPLRRGILDANIMW